MGWDFLFYVRTGAAGRNGSPDNIIIHCGFSFIGQPSSSELNLSTGYCKGKRANDQLPSIAHGVYYNWWGTDYRLSTVGTKGNYFIISFIIFVTSSNEWFGGEWRLDLFHFSAHYYHFRFLWHGPNYYSQSCRQGRMEERWYLLEDK